MWSRQTSSSMNEVVSSCVTLVSVDDSSTRRQRPAVPAVLHTWRSVCTQLQSTWDQWHNCRLQRLWPYLGQLLTPYTPASTLHSQDIHLSTVMCRRDFNSAAPSVWNEVPVKCAVALPWLLVTRNSSGDEIVNVNFFYKTAYMYTFMQCAPEATEFS